jgi:histone H3/H4
VSFRFWLQAKHESGRKHVGRPKRGSTQGKPVPKGRFGDAARSAEIQTRIDQAPHFECLAKKPLYRLMQDFLDDVVSKESAARVEAEEQCPKPSLPNMSLGKGAKRLLHSVSEAYLTNLFLRASMVAGHAKRATVEPCDFKLLEALSAVPDLAGMPHVSLEENEKGVGKRPISESDSDEYFVRQPLPKALKHASDTDSLDRLAKQPVLGIFAEMFPTEEPLAVSGGTALARQAACSASGSETVCLVTGSCKLCGPH